MKENSLERIENDLRNGKKFLACDKLKNLINENPNNFILREKLAEIYYESGFLDRAGLYWILTEPKTREIQKCQEIYLSTVNNSGNRILKDFQFRGDENLLNEYAKIKLHKFQTDSFEKTGNVPIYSEKPKYSRQKSDTKANNSKFPTFIFFAVIISIIALIILGFYKFIEILVK